jgi:hypothetical protein
LHRKGPDHFPEGAAISPDRPGAHRRTDDKATFFFRFFEPKSQGKNGFFRGRGAKKDGRPGKIKIF